MYKILLLLVGVFSFNLWAADNISSTGGVLVCEFSYYVTYENSEVDVTALLVDGSRKFLRAKPIYPADSAGKNNCHFSLGKKSLCALGIDSKFAGFENRFHSDLSLTKDGRLSMEMKDKFKNRRYTKSWKIKNAQTMEYRIPLGGYVDLSDHSTMFPKPTWGKLHFVRNECIWFNRG